MLCAMTATHAPREMFVTLDHRQQFVRIEGSGSPAVVFDSGCGGDSSNWRAIAPQIATLTTAISYDRFGCGASSPGETPRTSGRMVDELHALLHRLDVSPPFVLVGLSFGGMNARLYASRYPNEVAGLVLLEPAHEELSQRMPPDFWQHESAQLANTSGALREEALALEESAKELLHERRDHFGDLPIVVITAGKKWNDTPSHIDVGAVDAAWRSLHRDIVASSRRGRHIDVARSGHNVHVDAPDVVIDAIRDVVRTVRGEIE